MTENYLYFCAYPKRSNQSLWNPSKANQMYQFGCSNEVWIVLNKWTLKVTNFTILSWKLPNSISKEHLDIIKKFVRIIFVTISTVVLSKPETSRIDNHVTELIHRIDAQLTSDVIYVRERNRQTRAFKAAIISPLWLANFFLFLDVHCITQYYAQQGIF